MNLKLLKYHPGQKKVVLFPVFGRVQIFLAPALLHMSNLYENIFFFCFKKTHKKTKEIPLARIYSYEFTFFFFQTIKDRALCFSTKKVLLGRVVLKCKLCLKNSIKLIIFFFAAARVKIISPPAFPETRVLFFLAPWQSKWTCLDDKQWNFSSTTDLLGPVNYISFSW